MLLTKLIEEIENLEKCLLLSSNFDVHQNIVEQIVLLKTEVEEIDFFIGKLKSVKNVRKIKEHFCSLADSGIFSVQKMWGVKRKLNWT